MKLNLFIMSATVLVVQLTIQSAQVSSLVKPRVFEGQKQKVCGRTFVQLVVFTCGASRLKRMSTEDRIDIPVFGSANNELVNTDSNKVLKPVKLESDQEPELKQSQSPTGSDFPHVRYAQRKHTRPSKWPGADPSWTDFFDMYKTYEKYISFSQDDSDQLSKDQTKVVSPTGPDFPHVRYLQRKRKNVIESNLIEQKCCQVGCTYDEIRSLC